MLVDKINYFWNKGEKYRFFLTGDFRIKLSRNFGKNLVFKYGESVLAELNGDELTIFKPYLWDGCSPSKLFGVPFFSTPSPASTAAASICHDLFYQFLGIDGCPWSRKFADDEFEIILKRNGFSLYRLYFLAVRKLGSIFKKNDRDRKRNLKIIEKSQHLV